MPIPPDAHLAPSDEVLTRRVGDELVLLHMTTEVYFSLDPVGTAMWEALAEHGTIDAARQALAPQYDVPPERLLRDLRDLVDQLLEKGLLAVRAA